MGVSVLKQIGGPSESVCHASEALGSAAAGKGVEELLARGLMILC